MKSHTNPSPPLPPEQARRVELRKGPNIDSLPPVEELPDELELPVGGGPTPVRVETIEPASAPTDPASPRLATTLGLGLLAVLGAEHFPLELGDVS